LQAADNRHDHDQGNSLFERENAKISANLERVYAGTKPAVLKRFGETDDRSDEVIS
jgi:L(+)-tartrate dehydratase beta subunit